jgi:hypothetical protein
MNSLFIKIQSKNSKVKNKIHKRLSTLANILKDYGLTTVAFWKFSWNNKKKKNKQFKTNKQAR